jgi:hypothetical protein
MSGLQENKIKCRYLKIHKPVLIPLYVTGGWRKLHYEELQNLYSSPSITRMIKTRGMRLAGNVARMRRGGMHIGYWWESQKERDHWEDKDVSGWTILKWILER